MPERRATLALLTRDTSGGTGGIHDHTRLLAGALADLGTDVSILDFGAGPRVGFGATGSAALQRARKQLRSNDFDALLIQYNPFMYGRWGFAPGLVVFVGRLRKVVQRAKLGLVIHEPYVPANGWRDSAMSRWQRWQLDELRARTDVAFVSTERWTRELRALPASQPTVHLPVGSSLPDMRHARADSRRRLGLDDALVLATFGTGHPSRDLRLVAAAANAAARSADRRVVLLNLGFQSPHIAGADAEVTLREPGFLEREPLARHLASADIYLAPLVDGVSTRRTTLMAALQHGLAVVGTDGSSTDTVLRRAGDALRLVPVGSNDMFVESVETLAASEAEREDKGANARRLYEEHFDWPALARSVLAGFQLPVSDETQQSRRREVV